MLCGLMFLGGMFLKDPFNILLPIIFMIPILLGIIIYSYILFAEDQKKKQK